MQRLDESTIYMFEGFRLDARNHRLFRLHTNTVVPLTPKVVDLLTYMVENPGRILAKDELIEAVWENAFVEESNLSQSIFVLRKALGENNKDPRFILTVPNRGYEFIADVTTSRPEDDILNESELIDGRHHNSPEIKERSNKKNNKFWWAVIPVLLGLGVLAVVFVSGPTITEPVAGRQMPLPAPRSVVVLPVRNLTGNKSDEFYADGMTESLITELAKIHGLRVISRNSAFELKGNTNDSVVLGGKLGVSHLLEGSLRRGGQTIRLESRLLDATSGEVVWSQMFERQMADILTVQDGIACSIAGELRTALCGQKDTDPKKYQTNIKAYQTFLKGRFYYYQRGTDPLFRAVEEFEKTLKIDPNYPPAYSALAEVYMTLETNGIIAAGEGYPKAEYYARQAIERDPDLPGSYSALAIAQTGKVSAEETERMHQKAVDVNPNYAPSWQRQARFYSARGRFSEAEFGLKKAQELDPLSLSVNYNLGELYLIMRDHERAIAQADHIFSIFPEHFGGYQIRTLALDRSNRYDEALAAAEKTHEVNRDIYKARILAHSGRWAEARELISRFEASDLGKNTPLTVTGLYAQLGEIDTAFIWLERAFAVRQPALSEINIEPDLDPLRSDPRFANFVAKIAQH